MILSRYCKIYPYKDNLFLLFSTKKASKILIPKSMLKDIKRGNISEEEKETLVKLGFLVNDFDEEKAEMLGFMDELNSINKNFSAILVMNLDCNLACKYCFEGSRKGKFYMTQKTADLFIDFVKERCLSINGHSGQKTMNRNPPSPPFSKGGKGGFDEIKITFYGGEPLLSTELIIYISEKLKAIANRSSINIGTPSPSPLPSREGSYERHSPLPWRERDRERGSFCSNEKGITFSASLITNGTLLTPDVVSRLKPLGLKTASVTLDGPKDVHDQFRPFKSGKGTFDLIVRNIKDVCDMINVQIGGNFTKRNYKEFPRLLDYLIDNGLTPDKISYVKFDPVFRESEEFMQPDFHEGYVSINEQWLFDAGIFLREAILRKGFQTQKIMPAACMIELKQNLVICYDGSIYKCPGFLGRERFCVGDLGSGIGDYKQSHNLDNYKNDECLNCSYLPLCFGGCRYMKFLRDGDMNGVDCKKSFLDASLEQLVTVS